MQNKQNKGMTKVQYFKYKTDSIQDDKLQMRKQKKKIYTKKPKKGDIGQILSYFLGESQFQKGQKLQEPMKTVYEWQNSEIKKFVQDPNLGDFIIKLPNPDNLSQQYEKIFPQFKQLQKQISFFYQDACQFYNDMFNIQDASKKKIQNQSFSFMIAFYLLDLDENFKQTQKKLTSLLLLQKLNQNQINFFLTFITKQIEIFLLIFDYYVRIQEMQYYDVGLKQSILMQSIEKALNIHMEWSVQSKKRMKQKKQMTYLNYFPKLKFTLKDKILRKQYKRSTISKLQDLNQHKKAIFQQFLVPFIQQNTKKLVLFQHVLGYDRQVVVCITKFKFLLLFTGLEKISTYFSYFMSHTNKRYCLLNYIKEQLLNESVSKKVFNGRLLQKTFQSQNMVWINNKYRPKDVYTLLRNCLVYQITQNCLLRVRMFLSKNQNYIIMIIKASEQVLEHYAQKNNISMQIEIGATDLFSFEPVDQFERPLRLNKYIKDEGFKKKYGLDTSNTQNEILDQQQKSIQSQATNIYKKAQKMNSDQLRVKIILGQEDCDQCFRWVSNHLHIKFINEENIAVNQYNYQEIDRQTWQCYYLYNKLLISFIKRIKKIFQTKSQGPQNDIVIKQINKNIGFLLRIMFLKAIFICNNLYYNFRQSRSIIPNSIKNLFIQKKKLKTLWDKIDVRQPSGYFQYIKSKSYQSIWRKYQINQRKDRSKFFPAQRLHITNRVITTNLNIGRSLQKLHILNYFPLHDPFILKNIKIQPYLLNLKEKNQRKSSQSLKNDSNTILHNMYVMYQSKNTQMDFTKKSIYDKLSISNSLFKFFSVQTVRFYCGEKIAFYFDFMKYMTKQAFPLIIPAFIIQIFLWVQLSQITKFGQSGLKGFNDALIFIVTVTNMFWTTNTVQQWKWQQKNLAQKFGVAELTQKNQKRVTFVGKYKRNFQTDEINFEYIPKRVQIFKSIFTFTINFFYVVFVFLVIIQIFVLKSIMFQQGLPQSTVNLIPSILIAIFVEIFNLLYVFVIKLITRFENHRTISSFQQSLISKSYIVTFVITFISLFIYAFFSSYIDAQYLCIIKTTQTKEIIQNCDYFVSSQLLSLIIVDLIFTIIAALLPFGKFKLYQHLQSKKSNPKIKFFYNKFQAIDQFYQEQDKMQSYMFNEEIDNSWIGYMNLINVFTALALFGPALPFVYVMMFISGVVRIHAAKYQMIYFAKRSIPVKANSINWWLKIIESVSILSIFTNIGYMIYTREIFSANKTQIFFFFSIVFLLLKYYISQQYQKNNSLMSCRNELKVKEVLMKKGQQRNKNEKENVNTDMINVCYDEANMKRKVPKLSKANVTYKRDVVREQKGENN